MNWKELLISEIETNYKLTDGLLQLVDDDDLEWKPSNENNWMTTGQLLCHLTEACGVPIKSFVAGNWEMPEGADFENLPPEQNLPAAENLPSVKSTAEAIALLEKDKKLALQMVGQCEEENLTNQISIAPWDSSEMILGYRLLQMVSHLTHHKSQLFYYLKLQGKTVNTSNLWGE
jgi:uncharacterized damage-inducible protein DinB